MISMRPIMHPNRKSVWPVVIAVILALTPAAALAGFKRINQPNPKDPMAVQIYQLDNGLTVYLTENHETPRFEAQIAVRAGSKHDPAESTGLARSEERRVGKEGRGRGAQDQEKKNEKGERRTLGTADS